MSILSTSNHFVHRIRKTIIQKIFHKISIHSSKGRLHSNSMNLNARNRLTRALNMHEITPAWPQYLNPAAEWWTTVTYGAENELCCILEVSAAFARRTWSVHTGQNWHNISWCVDKWLHLTGTLSLFRLLLAWCRLSVMWTRRLYCRDDW